MTSTAAASDEEPTFSVGQLSQVISRALKAAFGGTVWVRGEITGYFESQAGHVYFTLVEAGASAERNSDKLPVALFRNRRGAVDRALADSGMRMADGLEVRVAGEVGYYSPRSQAQLIMTAIDPRFTLGNLAAARENLLRTLAAELLLEKNGALEMPLVPLRVGLVTSDASAACADFLEGVANSGYAFDVTLCDARVQGDQAESTLVAALATLARRDLDVIAMVRGGGDRNDLLAFDTESVARAVANCRLPVVVGIGHETDDSVVDHVAHTSTKTPTACAAALVEMATGFDERLRRCSNSLRSVATAHLAQSGRRLDAVAAQVQRRAEARCIRARHGADGAARRLAESAKAAPRARAGLERATGAVIATARRRLNEARAAADSAAALVRSHDPQRVLARGFSVTRDGAGAVVRTVPAAGAELVTQTLAATIRSTVTASRPAPAQLRSEQHR
ncbi:MAG TPA: exodeoxyribonuclease VII large subunit [Acidimicrobiaceae bacterium]|nr:exodeoxyribonuclease VII large subunit [Acidimicrobiaceae bacterium]